MHKLKEIMERLEGFASQEVNRSVEQIDAQELGYVVDMIKDCTEAMYYYTIVEEMKNRKEEEKLMDKLERKYYEGQPRNSQGEFTSTNGGNRRNYNCPPEQYYPWEVYYDRDMDRQMGRMYYTESGGNSNNGNTGGSSRGYTDGYEAGYSQGKNQSRDYREGRSGLSRRYYMDMKNHEHDSQKKIQQLESYMNELSDDITEMIVDATPEEKTALKQKLLNLHQKI